VNLVVAQKAAEEFRPPRVLAVFPRDPQIDASNSKLKIQQAFVPQLMVKDWSQYITSGAVKLGETILREEKFEAQQAHLKSLIEDGSLAVLLIDREGMLQVISADEPWQVGDRLIYLMHDPTPKLLKLLSGSSQTSLKPEKLPEVEKIPVPQVVPELAVEVLEEG
jgi:Trk K+ transport system NAD-binding subunit